MPCPVCVIDGIVIISCRLLGIPDVITTFFIGILTATFAMILNKWLKERKMRHNYPVILIVLSAITLITLKLAGMW